MKNDGERTVEALGEENCDCVDSLSAGLASLETWLTG